MFPELDSFRMFLMISYDPVDTIYPPPFYFDTIRKHHYNRFRYIWGILPTLTSNNRLITVQQFKSIAFRNDIVLINHESHENICYYGIVVRNKTIIMNIACMMTRASIVFLIQITVLIVRGNIIQIGYFLICIR